MAANYPSSVTTFTKKVDLLDLVVAADVNSVYDEVTAIETVIGALPATSAGWSGSFDSATTSWTTLRDRIQNIEFGTYTAFTDRVSKSGGTTITSSANGTVSLAIQAKSGQTADLLQVKNSSGTTTAKVNSSGVLSYNGNVVATIDGTETLSNKTLSGAVINGSSNSVTNLAPSSVIVTGTTNIQQYVDSKAALYYQGPTAPSAPSVGSIWVDSSTDVTPFDPTSYLQVSAASVTTSTGFRRIAASTVAPTSGDGADGDIWIQYV
ncbi:hypothetical protein UFOVP46_33 [uncultured Caudovirales phage]|uniref:Uncharacterized protein n=1 Tax=uncultured Caudovirales phage TaxID=2100421 RepID=A0A6J5KME6_9CAUD|nr:hypothetical protein UFOVP46_33 [uncultured Caudovirales phage]